MERIKKEKDNNENNKIYDKVIKASSLMNLITGEGKRRIATAMIYERVGTSEVFIGAYPFLTGSVKELGSYCVIMYMGKPIFTDVPVSDDYTIAKDKKINKIIEFVKFADDDFRVRGRVNSNYYTKSLRPVMEAKEVEVDGEKQEVTVHKVDDNGEELFEEVEEAYIEPKAVSQEGRDAIRIGNEYEEKMKEFRKRNEGFLSKYGNIVVPVVGLVMVSMVFLFGMKYLSDTYIGVASEIKDTTETLTPWYADEEGVKNLASKLSQAQNEVNAPPE